MWGIYGALLKVLTLMYKHLSFHHTTLIFVFIFYLLMILFVIFYFISMEVYS